MTWHETFKGRQFRLDMPLGASALLVLANRRDMPHTWHLWPGDSLEPINLGTTEADDAKRLAETRLRQLWAEALHLFPAPAGRKRLRRDGRG